MKIFKNKKKQGLTILEVILALSIGAVIIINVIQFLAELSFKERMKIAAGEIMTVNSGFMRRMQHDGNDFSIFVNQTPTNAATNVDASNAIYWDETTYATSFLNDYMVPVEACGNSGSWIPKDSDIGSGIREVPLIRCSMFSDGYPFGLDLSGVAYRDNNPDAVVNGISRFVTFIDFQNSEIFTRSGGLFSGNTNTNANRMVEFLGYLESRKPTDLFGTQTVELVEVDESGAFPTISNSDITPSACFLGGVNCRIALIINFTGGNNQQFLRVDGQNAMLAPIKFSMSGSDAADGEYQTCVRWVRDTAGTWEQDLVECGVRGGLPSSTVRGSIPYVGGAGDGVEAVTTKTSTEGLFITYKPTSYGESETEAPGGMNNADLALCQIYTAPSDTDGFVDDAFTLGAEIPCGIYNTSTTADEPNIQVVADSQAIETLTARNASIVDIAARMVRIKQLSADYSDPVFSIQDFEDNLIYTVSDSNNDNVFEFVADGEYLINGTSTVNGNFFVVGDTELNGNLIQNGNNATFNLTNMSVNLGGASGLVIDNDSLGTPPHPYAPSGDYVRLLGAVGSGLKLESSNIVMEATDSIGLDAPEVVVEGGSTLIMEGNSDTYSENSDFNPIQQSYTSANAEQRALRSFVTKDYVQHLDNIKSNINLRYVNVMTPENSYLPKPDCLDFTSTTTNQALYNGSAALTTDGRDLARIILIPISFKTYSNAYGSNQFYTHHAQEVGSGWEVYFYISGDGSAGTGAREDGAGTSLAMIYCDYSGVDFTPSNP